MLLVVLVGSGTHLLDWKLPPAVLRFFENFAEFLASKFLVVCAVMFVAVAPHWAPILCLSQVCL